MGMAATPRKKAVYPIACARVEARRPGYMAMVDANGLPVDRKPGAGQADDGHGAHARHTQSRRCATCRPCLRCRGLAQGNCRDGWPNIPSMPQRRDGRAFDALLYRHRNPVERCFNKLKHFRALATRYDKRDDDFPASVQLASVRIGSISNGSVTLTSRQEGSGHGPPNRA